MSISWSSWAMSGQTADILEQFQVKQLILLEKFQVKLLILLGQFQVKQLIILDTVKFSYHINFHLRTTLFTASSLPGSRLSALWGPQCQNSARPFHSTELGKWHSLSLLTWPSFLPAWTWLMTSVLRRTCQIISRPESVNLRSPQNYTRTPADWAGISWRNSVDF